MANDPRRYGLKVLADPIPRQERLRFNPESKSGWTPPIEGTRRFQEAIHQFLPWIETITGPEPTHDWMHASVVRGMVGLTSPQDLNVWRTVYNFETYPLSIPQSSDADGEARSYTLKHRRPYLVYIDSFLDAHQIANILNHKNFKPAHVDGERSDPTIRNNSAIRLPTTDGGLIQLCQRVARLTNTNLSKVEQLQLVRYRDNEQYHPHHDASEEHKRLYSFFVYLNDIPEGHGGETKFPYLNLSFRPKIGDALFWTNFI